MREGVCCTCQSIHSARPNNTSDGDLDGFLFTRIDEGMDSEERL